METQAKKKKLNLKKHESFKVIHSNSEEITPRRSRGNNVKQSTGEETCM